MVTTQKTQNQTSTTPKTSLKDDLIPAEVNARSQREGKDMLKVPSQKGTTVDQEGLTNNYGIEPDEYLTVPPTPEESQQYLVMGIAAAAFVGCLGLIAVFVR